MKTLIRVCAIAILMVWIATNADARVIAGDLDNGVAVYYFNSLTDSGHVFDYSGNGLHGILDDDTWLERISGRNCLLLSDEGFFFPWGGNKPLFVSKEFSIVAWVKIPRQTYDFPIYVYADRPVDDFTWEAIGEVGLWVGADNTLRGDYSFDAVESVSIETRGRNVNNNRWHHIGFVINSFSMQLYLNGKRIATRFVNRHRSFNGPGSGIIIGASTRGSVDDVGFFRNDFSDAQVKLIYDRGLANIISIAPVDPNGKVATTWATLKKR